MSFTATPRMCDTLLCRDEHTCYQPSYNTLYAGGHYIEVAIITHYIKASGEFLRYTITYDIDTTME